MSQLAVGIVSTQKGWRGGEEQALLLAEGLRSRGHCCQILALHGGRFAERMAAEGFDVQTFSGSRFNPVTLWNVRNLLKRNYYDVLHFNDAHALTIAGMASQGLQVPVRVMARRVDFDIRSPSRYRRICDRVICVSQAVSDVCFRCGIPLDQLCVVHDGVDPKRVASGDRSRGRRALELSDDRPLLLVVSSLTDHKGHRFLLDAMPQVLANYPRVQLALAGSGELLEALQSQAAGRGIGEAIRFLGFRKDVPDLIHAADLVVQPSHLEGLCSSLIDVMLAGRPIVATTAGGIPELLGPLETDRQPVSWLVPPRNPGALAEAICDALADADQCEVYSWQAQRRAFAEFVADRMVDRTLAVYQDILAAKGFEAPDADDRRSAA